MFPHEFKHELTPSTKILRIILYLQAKGNLSGKVKVEEGKQAVCEDFTIFPALD
jgi:hypothetical protein